MADVVKDAILNNEFHDLVLLRLVDLTVSALRSSKPLFRTLLEEPAFFRKHFQVWVSEALDERERLQAVQQEDVFQ